MTFGNESAPRRVPPLFFARISFQGLYFRSWHKDIIPNGLFSMSYQSINLKTVISVSASLALQRLRSGKNFPNDSLARWPALSNEAAHLTNGSRSLLGPEAQRHYTCAGPKLISILPHE